MAVIATAVGIAFDAGSGDKELTTVFAALYVMGCVAAVLMVEQSAVFTAVIQPPLILFCAVPGAYWLFHGGGFPGLKNIVINCGYPLIERFPLMLFTAAIVLLIGMVRWYLGMLDHAGTPQAEGSGTRRRSTLLDKLGTMLTAALNRDPAHAIEPSSSRTSRERRPRERRPGERPRRATPESRRAAREAASGTSSRSRTRSTERRRDPTRAAPTRSRHVRPAAELHDQPPRRRRPAPELQDQPLRRRRPAPERHNDPPRRRGEPIQRTRRESRSYRSGEAPTRHPVSQVRYRNAAGEARNDEVDSWEYDI